MTTKTKTETKKAKWSVKSDRTTQSVTVTYNPKNDTRYFALADLPESLLRYLATIGLKNILEDSKASSQMEAEGWAAVEKRWNTLLGGNEVSAERGAGAGGLKAKLERVEAEKVEAESQRQVALDALAALQVQMMDLARAMEELKAAKTGKAGGAA